MRNDGVFGSMMILLGILIGAGIFAMVTSSQVNPSEGFTAVCEDRGGVVYGANGCFDPADAIYVEKDK